MLHIATEVVLVRDLLAFMSLFKKCIPKTLILVYAVSSSNYFFTDLDFSETAACSRRALLVLDMFEYNLTRASGQAPFLP